MYKIVNCKLFFFFIARFCLPIIVLENQTPGFEYLKLINN
jgi:hypothetical protein